MILPGRLAAQRRVGSFVAAFLSGSPKSTLNLRTRHIAKQAIVKTKPRNARPPWVLRYAANRRPDHPDHARRRWSQQLPVAGVDGLAETEAAIARTEAEIEAGDMSGWAGSTGRPIRQPRSSG